MARDGSDKGFDDQWYASKRRGQYKASRGEGAWSEDKYLQRLDARLSGPPAHHAKPGGSGCLALMIFLVLVLVVL